MMRKAVFSLSLVISAWLAFGFLPWQQASEKGDWRFVVRRPAAPHPISPWIYGMAAVPASMLRDQRVPMNRWGGNTASRYNWKLGNAWNAGMDWFFANVAVETDAWKGFLARTRDAGATAVLTVPLVGHVARDTGSYSFSVRKYGNQQQHAPGRPDMGNGRLPDGRNLYGNDPQDANLPVGPEFVAEWMESIQAAFPGLVAARRLVVALGNEPMLWNRTHRDVHPAPVTYDEYLKRYIATAKVVRRAMPEVLLAGPELWGWPALFQSARDRDQGGGLDRRKHGGQPFLPWFLDQLRAHEKNYGECLLDVVTVHFYPQAQGVHSGAANPSTQLRRIATTRSLFDPAYSDPSWIDRRIALIPRLKQWIDEAYPGRMLGVTEYNWGGETDISGAIAVADILGIFGREGLDLACYWTHPPAGSPAAQAYSLYRNVDGNGAAFGTNRWEVVWDGDPAAPYEACSVYAAELPEEGLLTVVAINKTNQTQTLRLRSGSEPLSFVSGYRVDGAATDGIAAIMTGDCTAIDRWLALTMRPRSLYHLRLELDR